MPDRLLIEGGHVVTLDGALGDIADCDILVEDGVIVDVRPDIEAADADVVDGRGCVVVPGFVDTHRHTWNSISRGEMPCGVLHEYYTKIMSEDGPRYRPQDVYSSGLLGVVEALSGGTTTTVDWSTISNSPEHADAAIQALRDAGTRAVYTHGWPMAPEYHLLAPNPLPHPEDARRIRAEHFPSDDDLVTFALGPRGTFAHPAILHNDFQLARDLDARISIHVDVRITGRPSTGVEALAREGLMGPDVTYVHATQTSDAGLKAIAESGGSVSVGPYIEMVMGHGVPPIPRMLAAGLRPSLSTDTATTGPGEMFTPMRAALAIGRIASFPEDYTVPFSSPLTHRDVLEFATIEGARACGLDDRIGSITPGKQADLVLVRADQVNTLPLIDPVAVVVTSADTSNVDSVFVRGRAVKRHGVLVDQDLDRLRSLVEASRAHLDGETA